MQNIVDSLRWRYAVKRFDPDRRIPPQDWAAVEESLVLSPSAYNLQPWRFVVVHNRDLKKALRAASQDQRQVEECSHLVVLTARRSIDEAYLDFFLMALAQQRGISIDSLDGYRRMVTDDVLAGRRGPIGEWTARQTYLALGNLLAVAALARIDACPLEGIDPEGYDRILDLSGSHYRTLVACAMGYRHAADSYAALPKVRLAKEAVMARR